MFSNGAICSIKVDRVNIQMEAEDADRTEIWHYLKRREKWVWKLKRKWRNKRYSIFDREIRYSNCTWIGYFCRERVDQYSGTCIGFAGLEYISSAGLRVILKMQKFMNVKGTMKLIHVSDIIQDVFDITGFADILSIEWLWL